MGRFSWKRLGARQTLPIVYHPDDTGHWGLYEPHQRLTWYWRWECGRVSSHGVKFLMGLSARKDWKTLCGSIRRLDLSILVKRSSISLSLRYSQVRASTAYGILGSVLRVLLCSISLQNHAISQDPLLILQTVAMPCKFQPWSGRFGKLWIWNVGSLLFPIVWSICLWFFCNMVLSRARKRRRCCSNPCRRLRVDDRTSMRPNIHHLKPVTRLYLPKLNDSSLRRTLRGRPRLL